MTRAPLRLSLLALLALIAPACTDSGDDAPSVDMGADAAPDPCDAVDCGEHGRCVLDGDRTACLCAPGWSGEACETGAPCAVADCGERLCAVTDGAAVCVCPRGLIDDGDACREPPVPGPCAEAACDDPRICALVDGEAVCVCPPGTVPGPDGDCAPPPVDPCAALDCGEQSCALVDGTPTCVCPPGELPDGDGCAPAPPPACAAVDCGDRLCALDDGEPICVCPPGLIDDGAGGCDDAPGPGPCTDAPCPAGQLCAVRDGAAVCVCPPGELDDGMGGCAPPAPGACADDPCPAPGRLCAIGGDGEPVCACEPGLLPAADGDGCVEPDDGPIDPCAPNPCVVPGRTICRAAGEVALCACAPGFVDDPAGDGCLPAPDGPCDPNPCLDDHRTVCQPAGAVAICGCDPGYVDVGGRCQEADPCSDAVCPEPGRGQCVVVEGAPVCACDPGLVDGPGGACVVDDPCDPNPCQRPGRGVCRPLDGVVICECDPGTLPLEDGGCRAPDPCDPNPCLAPDRGTCEVLPDGPICRCDPGLVEDAETGACVLEPIGDCADSHLDGDAYEPDECPPEATPLVVDVPQDHTIMPAGDDDWYVIDAIPDHIYRFAVERTGLPDAYVYLYDRDGATVLESHDSPESIVYELPDAGPYFYRVRAYSGNQTGAYRVSITDEGLDDHGDDAAGATPIEVGGAPVDGDIETRGDDDWFAFEAEAGRIYRFTLRRVTMSDAYVYLYRPDGTTIEVSRDSPEAIAFDNEEGGTWYLRVRHYSNVGLGRYTVEVTDEGVDDHADGIEGATPITTDDTPIAGRIETRGDDDHFAFEAEAGHVYRVRLTRGTLSDGYLHLYAPDGAQRVASDTETIYYEADVAGIWTVRARHYSSASTGDYQLSVTDLGPDDHADGFEGATPLVVDGEAVAGDIETAGDHDYFAVELPAGRIIRLSMTRQGISDGVITLYGPDGAVVANADSEVILLEITEGGLYHLRARHYLGSGRGGYTVQATDEGADDHADGPEGATVLVPDAEPTAGEIETGGDNDYFAFDAAPGRIYRLALTRAGLSDGYIYLYAPDGETSLYASDVESLSWEFDEGGRHYFRVRHYNSTGRGAYTVQVTDLGVDDHADTAEGATPIAADGVAVGGTLETRGDVDVFALDLDGGQIYRLSTQGIDVRITVYAGDAVTRLGSTGGDQLDVEVGAAGLHYVEIRADNGSTIGGYSLTVVD